LIHEGSPITSIIHALRRCAQRARSAFGRLAPSGIRMPLGVFLVSFLIFSTFTQIKNDTLTAAVTVPSGPEAAASSVPAPPLAVSPAAPPATLIDETALAEIEEGFGAETPAVVAEPAPAAPPAVAYRVKNPDSSWMPQNITRGNTGAMEVALTFDGGINGDEATQVLDTLRSRGVRTTIFLTGAFINRYPDLARQIVADGHEVGNHLMTHPHLTDYARTYTHRTLPHVTREFLTAQLKRVERRFAEVTGREMAPVWRAPYGEVNSEIRRWAFDAGYVHVGWTSDYARRESLDTLDWVSDRTSRLYLSSSEIRDKVLGFGQGAYEARGGIILMHMGTRRKTDKAVDSLGEIIDGMRDRGYRFVKVSTLVSHVEDGPRALETASVRKRVRNAPELARLGRDAKHRPSM